MNPLKDPVLLEAVAAAIRRRAPPPPRELTYDEIVEALRRGEELGDCVPDDIEGMSLAIVALRKKT